MRKNKELNRKYSVSDVIHEGELFSECIFDDNLFLICLYDFYNLKYN